MLIVRARFNSESYMTESVLDLRTGIAEDSREEKGPGQIYVRVQSMAFGHISGIQVDQNGNDVMRRHPKTGTEVPLPVILEDRTVVEIAEQDVVSGYVLGDDGSLQPRGTLVDSEPKLWRRRTARNPSAYSDVECRDIDYLS